MKELTVDNKNYSDWVKVAAIVLIAVFVLIVGKKFLGAIGSITGLSNSDEKEEINDLFENSPNFPLHSSSWKSFWEEEIVGHNVSMFTVAVCRNMADELERYRGILFEDSEEAVGLFKRFTNKASVSWFAYQFWIYKGKDLFDFMRKDDTLFSQGFEAKTLSKIVADIKNKPNF